MRIFIRNRAFLTKKEMELFSLKQSKNQEFCPQWSIFYQNSPDTGFYPKMDIFYPSTNNQDFCNLMGHVWPKHPKFCMSGLNRASLYQSRIIFKNFSLHRYLVKIFGCLNWSRLCLTRKSPLYIQCYIYRLMAYRSWGLQSQLYDL